MTARLQSGRVTAVVRVLARHGVAHVVARHAARVPWLASRLPLAALTGPQRFRRLFEDLGGSFIKFGQMLALQPDIVSLAYCDELFNLLDRIPPFPVDDVRRIFEAEIGQPPEAVFERFEPAPLATASIGQVHVAWHHGQKVAVKVQRPSVDTDFMGDIRLMAWGIQMIRRARLRSLYWMLEPMGEFVAWTREELEYRREARYAERLRRNAADNPHERVPAIDWALTTRRTLVVEFLEGTTVLDYLRAVADGDAWTLHQLRAQGFDPNRFARHIIDNFLGDAFQHGVFHADLHPANLLILPDNVVGYVDFGITGVLSRYSRRHLIAMTLAYTRADVTGMADAFFRLTTAEPDADPARFRRVLAEMSHDWYEGEGTETVFKKNFTLVMLDMLTLSRQTGIWPERDVIKYIRSAIAADGLITRFAPRFNVGRYLEEVCSRWMAWEAQRALLQVDGVAEVAASGLHLLDDGLGRVTTVMRRLSDGDMLARVDVAPILSRDGALRRRTIRLVGVVAALVALFEVAAPEARWGWNLFSVGATLIAGALLLLVSAMRQLAART